MSEREASCSCGRLRVFAGGDPIRISMCHCLACQKRTGSAFGIQARFPADRVRVEGHAKEHTRISDEGESRTMSFCPHCGSTVFWRLEGLGAVAVAIGAFADPAFPQPRVSVWESRRHPWVGLPEEMEHLD